MSYEVTANRKRPSTFDSLVGQEFVVTTLKNSIASGRIAHAYLFSGPRGVGKTSAARILAKALNCEKGPTPEPCGVCANCKGIASGSSLDVIEIDGASNTSVNDVREIKDEVLFAPASSRYKVYIIDEVHMLSNSAFNALLKTIEEPPPYIVFIFATTEIHKVPPTIRSRCQQFSFRLIPLETIVAKLREAASDMKVQVEEAALLWIAKEATGSLRDAYTIFDQVVSFAEGRLTLEKIQDKMGLTGFDRVNALAELLAMGKGREALALFDEIVTAGVGIEQFVAELTDYYRSLLFLKQGIRKASLLGFAAERFSPQVVETLTVRQIEKALSLLLELYRNLRYTINGRFEVELVLSRLADLRNFLSREELWERVQELRRELRYASERREGDSFSSAQNPGHESGHAVATGSSAPITATSPMTEGPEGTGGTGGTRGPSLSPAPKSGPGSYPEDAGELTPEQRKAIVSLVKKKKLTLSTALEKAEAWKVEGNRVALVFKNKFNADLVQSDIAQVTQKTREVLGRNLEVVVRYEPPKEAAEGVGQGGLKTGEGLSEGDGENKEEKRVEDRVEIAKRVFRGEIVQ